MLAAAMWSHCSVVLLHVAAPSVYVRDSMQLLPTFLSLRPGKGSETRTRQDNPLATWVIMGKFRFPTPSL